MNLKLIDDPVTARDAYAAGRKPHPLGHPRHDGPLRARADEGFAHRAAHLPADRLVQRRRRHRGAQPHHAASGTCAGKTIVYAQNSPSQYFLNNLLLNAGIQPGEVNHKYTATAFEAAAAFVADRKIDACVSWAPDIYNIPEKVKNTRILTTTGEANKLIADVWVARADFAKDHPEIIEGLVAGIFDGMRRSEGRHEEGPGLPVDGRGLRHDRGRGQGHGKSTPTPPTSPRTRSSSSTRTPRPTSSAPGRTSPSSTRNSA